MKRFPVAILLGAVSVLTACGSDPVQPSSPTPTPTPVTSPGSQPVAAGNMVALSAPGTAPSSPTDPIVGRYSLEVAVESTPDPDCNAVPAHAKRRTYTADIEPFRTYYAAKLYDATFLRDGTGIGYGCKDNRLDMGGVCHQFILQRGEGSSLSVVMEPEDEWRGSEIVEVLTADRYLLSVQGRATGTFSEGRIVATGAGSFWYGNGLPASDYKGCYRNPITLTFTRR